MIVVVTGGGSIEAELRRALRDHAARIKHDLGKYVAFQARWLPVDPPAEELRAALEADLLSTRRGPGATLDALAVWQSFRAPLVGESLLEGEFTVDLRDQAHFSLLDDAMTDLATYVLALQSQSALDLGDARAAAMRVADACSAFLKTFREQT